MDMHLLLIILSVTQAISVYLSISPSLSHPEGEPCHYVQELKNRFKKKQNKTGEAGLKGRTVRIWDLGGQREGWLLNAETPRWRMGGGGKG